MPTIPSHIRSIVSHDGAVLLDIPHDQVRPFGSHAWVEIEGHVVNDKPYMREIYQVLDEC